MNRTEILNRLVDLLNEALQRAADNGDWYDEDTIHAYINRGDCTISAMITETQASVEVCPENGHDYSNIERWLEARIHRIGNLDIEAPGDIWTNHGFANEADYLRYRYG